LRFGARSADYPEDQGSATRVVHGLEAIIDAAAGVLAQKSLIATLDGMVRELRPIVPFTSLAVYEADHAARVLVPSTPSAAGSRRRWPIGPGSIPAWPGWW
jgi:hypothetical protein